MTTIEKMVWSVAEVKIISKNNCVVNFTGLSLNVRNRTTCSHSVGVCLNDVLQKEIFPGKMYCGTITYAKNKRNLTNVFFDKETNKADWEFAYCMQIG